MERPGVEYVAAKPTNMPKTDIEAYAEKTARVLGFDPGDDVHKIVTSLGGQIEVHDIFSSPDKDTIFVHGPGDFTIVLSDVSSDLRDRFTLAHELGHYFLHSNQGDRRIKAARSGTGRLEWEANWFAASFLMPVEAFRAAARMTPWSIALAAKFRVSEAAASIRKQSLGC